MNFNREAIHSVLYRFTQIKKYGFTQIKMKRFAQIKKYGFTQIKMKRFAQIKKIYTDYFYGRKQLLFC